MITSAAARADAAMPSSTPLIRNAAYRWQAIQHLIDRLQRIVRANVSVDHITESALARAHYLQTAAQLERELEKLDADVDDEIDRVTADILRTDLKAQRRRDTAAAMLAKETKESKESKERKT